MTDKDLLEEFFSNLTHSWGKAASTALSYRNSLKDFMKRAEVKDLKAITTADIDRYMGRLGMVGSSQHTMRNRLSAVRSLFRWLHTRGHISTDPTENFKRIPVRTTERIPVLTRDELQKIIYGCDPPEDPKKGRREREDFYLRRVEVRRLVFLRDTALLALCYDLGLRAGEPSLLMRRDWDEVRGYLDIRGAKWSMAPEKMPAHSKTTSAMAVYLQALRDSRFGDHPALFPPIGGRPSTTKQAERGINSFAVFRILRDRVALAGIKAQGRRISPHTLRYSVATHYFEDGVPLLHIQALMRHKSIETTRRYIRLGPLSKIKRSANKRLFPPKKREDDDGED